MLVGILAFLLQGRLWADPIEDCNDYCKDVLRDFKCSGNPDFECFKWQFVTCIHCVGHSRKSSCREGNPANICGGMFIQNSFQKGDVDEACFCNSIVDGWLYDYVEAFGCINLGAAQQANTQLCIPKPPPEPEG